MTNNEFDILDELYFVCTFDDLVQKLDLSEDEIKNTLLVLLQKEWIRCLENEVEIAVSLDEYLVGYKKYTYIASKKGLFAHNTL
ncbi:MAG: hypothetical protein RLZZ175_221 [Bacteroidota bacterium]